jgi:hypothetical protein
MDHVDERKLVAQKLGTRDLTSIMVSDAEASAEEGSSATGRGIGAASTG